VGRQFYARGRLVGVLGGLKERDWGLKGPRASRGLKAPNGAPRWRSDCIWRFCYFVRARVGGMERQKNAAHSLARSMQFQSGRCAIETDVQGSAKSPQMAHNLEAICGTISMQALVTASSLCRHRYVDITNTCSGPRAPTFCLKILIFSGSIKLPPTRRAI